VTACILSISLFLISTHVCRENEYPKVYIAGFRSKWIQWRWNRGIRGLRPKIICTTWSNFVGLPFLARLGPQGLLYIVGCLYNLSFQPHWFISVLSPIAPWKLTTLKEGFSSRKCLNQNEGDFVENPRNQCKTCGNII
jgi:hypothetical protein